MTGLTTLTAAVTLCLQGIVNNLVHLVESYGHVPNGIRYYYINRRRAQNVGQRRKGGEGVERSGPPACFVSQGRAARCGRHSAWRMLRLKESNMGQPPGKEQGVHMLNKLCEQCCSPHPPIYPPSLPPSHTHTTPATTRTPHHPTSPATPTRSQPPLLSEMVRLVHEAAPCRERLARWLDALLAEHAYWARCDGPAAKQVRCAAHALCAAQVAGALHWCMPGGPARG